MKKWIELLGDGIIIAFGVLTFMIFMPIITVGYIKMVEPNLGMAIAELVLGIVAMIIGIERGIDDGIHYFGKK